MNYKEAEVVLPIGRLFDEYILYAEQEPLHPKNTTVTRADAIAMLQAAKQMALLNYQSTGIPPYDVFKYTFKSLHNKVFEGRGPCAFSPTLCVWMQNSHEIISSLNAARAASNTGGQ